MNPYAPPDEERAPAKKRKRKRPREARPVGVWREDAYMVVDQGGAELPDRCVVCNAPAGGYKLRKRFMWHPQWVYVLICIGLLFYLIGALVTRKGGTVELGLCDEHQERRRQGLTLAWAGLGVGFVLMLGCVIAELNTLIPLAVLVMIALPIAGAVIARTVTVHKIDDRHMWFKVGPVFLESLPDSDER